MSEPQSLPPSSLPPSSLPPSTSAVPVAIVRRHPAVLVPLAALIVLFAGLKAAESVLVPFVFSAFLAVLTAPIVAWLRRHRIPPLVSIPVILLLVVALLLAAVGFIGTSVNAFIDAMPRYRARWEELTQSSLELLGRYDVEISPTVLRDSFDPGAAISMLGSTLAQLASVLSDTLLVVLTLAFMLFEAIALPNKIRVALGDPEADLSTFGVAAREVQRYIAIKTYVSAGTGLLVWLMLAVLGVDFAPLWGLVAFLLNFVPNIGSIVAGVPPVLLALVQLGLGHALVALSGFVIINMVIGNMIEPRVMGLRLGLSSLVVFVSLLFWGWLWGAMGMLLSVPLTMVVKIGLEQSEGWRWLAVLMGGDQPDAGAAAPGSTQQRNPMS